MCSVTSISDKSLCIVNRVVSYRNYLIRALYTCIRREDFRLVLVCSIVLEVPSVDFVFVDFLLCFNEASL